MPGCSYVRVAEARFSSARAATAVSGTAGHGAAGLPGANRYVPPDGAISKRAAAGTAMPSASGAIGTGVAKGCDTKK